VIQVAQLNKCPYCYGGYVLDKESPDYKDIDNEIDRLFDGGQFSYYDAFIKVTGKTRGVKKCTVCNGTGKSSN
jgi:RecJ-like exonuclease